MLLKNGERFTVFLATLGAVALAGVLAATAGTTAAGLSAVGGVSAGAAGGANAGLGAGGAAGAGAASALCIVCWRHAKLATPSNVKPTSPTIV